MGLAILERINHRIAERIDEFKEFFKRDGVMSISDYLDPRLVLFLESEKRDEALLELVALLNDTSKLKSAELFYQALQKREQFLSTGIGLGVAIPHAKLEGYDTFFIAIGIHKKGIEWNALDGAPVRLIFMIGGPDNQQTEYLKILSLLTMAIKNEERRKKMIKATSAQEVLELFASC